MIPTVKLHGTSEQAGQHINLLLKYPFMIPQKGRNNMQPSNLVDTSQVIELLGTAL